MLPMQRFTALIHRSPPDEGGFWATCLEVPGANDQGETREECLSDLSAAVKLILQINREEALAADPDAQETELSIA